MTACAKEKINLKLHLNLGNHCDQLHHPGIQLSTPLSNLIQILKQMQG
jgi:hypothetical protein